MDFGPEAVSATVKATSQLSGARSGSAARKVAPGVPARSVTNPPNSDRAAEADDLRARSLVRAGDQARPAERVAASASAAKPDALEASPEAVGKSLCVSTSARVSMCASARTRSSRAKMRGCAAGSPSWPPKTMRSEASRSSKDTVVRVDIASRVSERLGTAGRLPSPGTLPQYFTSAMFERAMASYFMAPLPSRPPPPPRRRARRPHASAPEWARPCPLRARRRSRRLRSR